MSEFSEASIPQEKNFKQQSSDLLNSDPDIPEIQEIIKEIALQESDIIPKSTFNSIYKIRETPAGFEVRLPAGYTDQYAIGTTTQFVDTQEEAEQLIKDTRQNFRSRIEYMSLQKTFSPFYSIKTEDHGTYSVTIPALQSSEGLLVGTTSITF
ncbi:MAG TPA: hypothetical protein PLS49_04600, partial [Candidatus Woesebacteria bacterium]|nr:hypothetical protein [Candidatus Woesebacteria bacterium]